MSIFNSIGTSVYKEHIENAGVTKRIPIGNWETGHYSVVIQPVGRRVAMKKLRPVDRRMIRLRQYYLL